MIQYLILPKAESCDLCARDFDKATNIRAAIGSSYWTCSDAIGRSCDKRNDVKAKHPTPQNKIDIRPNHLPPGSSRQRIRIRLELPAIPRCLPDPLDRCTGKALVVDDNPPRWGIKKHIRHAHHDLTAHFHLQRPFGQYTQRLELVDEMVEPIAVFKNIFRVQRTRHTMTFQKIAESGNADRSVLPTETIDRNEPMQGAAEQVGCRFAVDGDLFSDDL